MSQGVRFTCTPVQMPRRGLLKGKSNNFQVIKLYYSFCMDASVSESKMHVTGHHVCKHKMALVKVCLIYGLVSQSTTMVMSGCCLHFIGLQRGVSAH